jgi:hypothetical protein
MAEDGALRRDGIHDTPVKIREFQMASPAQVSLLLDLYAEYQKSQGKSMISIDQGQLRKEFSTLTHQEVGEHMTRLKLAAGRTESGPTTRQVQTGRNLESELQALSIPFTPVEWHSITSQQAYKAIGELIALKRQGAFTLAPVVDIASRRRAS